MTTLGLRGLFDNGRQARPVVERIRDNCEIDPRSKCWLWRGHCDIGGYGQTKVGSTRNGTNRSVRCHVATWEALHGLTPLGLELDHFVCDTPRCANPDHVRPVTPLVNTLRSQGVTAQNARKQVCPQCKGPYSLKPNGRARYCRPCYLLYLRNYNAVRNSPISAG
jgi:hypothetical protein